MNNPLFTCCSCICYLAFMAMFSCDRDKQEHQVRIKVIKEITIPANDMISVNPGNTRFIESDSGTYLFASNHVKNNFQFIDFESGDVVHEVPIRLEGPNNVKGISGLTLLNLDSIWVMTSRPPALNLMNFAGEVLLKREINNTLRPFPINYMFLSSHQALYQNGSRIFGPQPLLEGHHDISKNDLEKYQLLFSYDFDEDSVSWYDVFYAADYWDKGKILSNFSWDKKGTEMIIAPWYDHEIQIVDMENGLVKNRKKVKSSSINNFYYVNEIPWGENEGLINTIIHDRYGPLLYDSFREVFYRLFLPGMEVDANTPTEKLQALGRSTPSVGIMVLDADLNIIAEHLFDEFEINGKNNMFVGKNGLYLSRNNENHPDFDEDHFRYVMIRFE